MTQQTNRLHYPGTYNWPFDTFAFCRVILKLALKMKIIITKKTPGSLNFLKKMFHFDMILHAKKIKNEKRTKKKLLRGFSNVLLSVFSM